MGSTTARIMGGCSSHNECAVVWAPPGDYATWSVLGREGWGFNRQRQYLLRAHTLLNARAATAEERNRLENAFLSAAQELGLDALDDPSAHTWGPGATSLPRNIVDGVRWNAVFAYIDPLETVATPGSRQTPWSTGSSSMALRRVESWLIDWE